MRWQDEGKELEEDQGWDEEEEMRAEVECTIQEEI